MHSMIRIACLRACLVLLLGLTAAAPAAAQQGWIALMRNTPAEQFDDEDIKLFIDAARKAIAETPEQGTVSWDNPKTKSAGSVTVVKVFTWQNHPCRKLKIVSEARGRKGTNSMSLCQVEEKWRVVTDSQLAK
jgi:surface antigen